MKRRKKRIIYLVLLAAAAFEICAGATPTYADVTCTTASEPESSNAIGVAGKPDFYPYEYYDEATQSYQGVFPELLDLISDEMDVDFVYVNAGTLDTSLRDSKTAGVDLLTAYQVDAKQMENYKLDAGPVVLTYKSEDIVEIGFAYTGNFTDENREAFEAALEQIPDEEIASLMAKYAADRVVNNGIATPIFIVIVVLLAAVVVFALLFFLRWKRLTEKNQKDAVTDSLTGIGNRLFFEQEFRRLVAFQYKALYTVAYIAFDIKRVNEYYDEQTAEEQICFAANKLTELSETADIVARITGGGFAFAHVCSAKTDAKLWAAKVLEQLNEYCARYERDFKPVFRAGLYCLNIGEWDCPRILEYVQQTYKKAEAAEIPYMLMDSQHVRDEHLKKQLKHETGTAIEEKDILLYVQPVVYAADGQIAFAEALSRWKHPTMGLLSPGRFVEIMTEVGAIVQLDFYMFEQTCRAQERWQKLGKNVGMSVNFTRVTITAENFKERFREIAERYTFDRSRLIVEITEDALEKDKVAARENVQLCHDLGFRVALDDLGSGYTFFSDFKDYPIDLAKLDHSLLWSIKTEKDRRLFEAIVHLCQNLDIEVLCEGVENKEQLALARETGCKYIQGYYYYRPMSAEEFEETIL